MTEITETSATAVITDKKIGGKKKDITVRCLVFFDGTLNNKQNIQGRLDYEAKQDTEGSSAYKEFRQNKDKEGDVARGKLGVKMAEDSYENDFSNIVRLQQGVKPKQPGYDETVIVYMEGAGTAGEDPELARLAEKQKTENAQNSTNKPVNAPPKYGSDATMGFAMAAFETGIKTKVNWGVVKAMDKIAHGPDKDPRDTSQLIVKKLTIDIFGFSRGAASARYCVYQLLKEIDLVDEASLISVLEEGSDSGVKFRAEINTKYMLKSRWLAVQEVEVCFVGLFDTVCSYAGAQYVRLLPLENWFVKLKAIRKAKKVVQLASADEHRFHFSLHTIKSAGSKGEEYYLPGTHSDIGGGYLPEGSDAGLIVYQGGAIGSYADRKEYLEGQGWYQQQQLETTVSALGPDSKISGIGLLATALGDWINVMGSINKPRQVSNAYCQIPLKIMAKKAEDSGIAFNPKLIKFATKIINAYTELTEMEFRIRSYMGKVGPRGSELDDWHDPLMMLDEKLKLVRNKHFHFSARFNTYFGHNPRRSMLTGKRSRYIFNG